MTTTYKKYVYWRGTYPKYIREDTYSTLSSLQHEKIAVLDTETTGLKKTDQITEIAIVDYHSKRVLLNTMLCPKNIDASFNESKAAKVSGITYEQVLLQPTFQEIYPLILEVLSKYTIAGFNVDYDAKMLIRSAFHYSLTIPQFETLDVMKLFQAYMNFSDYHSLEEAQTILDLQLPENAHRALTDVYSTINVLKTMEKNIKEETVLENENYATNLQNMR